LLVEAKNLLRRLLGRPEWPDRKRASHTADVRKALAQPVAGMPARGGDPQLIGLAERAGKRPVTLTSREMFCLNGHFLPCWREEDVGLGDDWLESEDCYPLYHRLFQEIGAQLPSPRMLEIGVRTGYVGVAFARAVSGPRAYVGVDANLYLADGLARARAAFREYRRFDPDFRFQCILGYSDNPGVQRRLRSLAPFDIIHVDGDHSLAGKLVDLDLCRSLLSPRGLVLVDDYRHIPDVVPEAVGRALRLGWYAGYGIVATKRGMAVLQA
jgi:hypothetical protein